MTLGMLSVTIMTRKNVSNNLYPCIFLMLPCACPDKTREHAAVEQPCVTVIIPIKFKRFERRLGLCIIIMGLRIAIIMMIMTQPSVYHHYLCIIIIIFLLTSIVARKSKTSQR